MNIFTTMVAVPDGDTALPKRIEKEIRKSFPGDRWEVRGYKPFKKPHLPFKSGIPYWVTLEETSKKYKPTKEPDSANSDWV